MEPFSAIAEQPPKVHNDFPLWESLEIDIHSLCNRDCEFCPRYHDRSGVRKDAAGQPVFGEMPSRQFYSIIDQAASLGYRGKVKLHRLSEGLLDSRYLEFATHVKTKGFYLAEDTNGDVLRANTNLCEKLDGLIDHLTIGLYDYQTEMEKRREVLFWKSRFRKTHLSFSLPRESCIIRQNSRIYDHVQKNDKALEAPCMQPTRFFQIRYDGNVSLCCEDDMCRFSLGNAFTESLASIWWSRRHITMARILSEPSGRRRFSLCRKCYFSQPRISLLNNPL